MVVIDAGKDIVELADLLSSHAPANEGGSDEG
jgi:hypothetical protein